MYISPLVHLTVSLNPCYNMSSPKHILEKIQMAPRLSVSTFAKGTLVPLNEVQLTPFHRSETPEKMAWADGQLSELFSPEDILEIPINRGWGTPSAPTYVAWLQKALKASYRGDKKVIQSRVRGNSLFVRIVDRKESHRNGKVRHVIS